MGAFDDLPTVSKPRVSQTKRSNTPTGGAFDDLPVVSRPTANDSDFARMITGKPKPQAGPAGKDFGDRAIDWLADTGMSQTLRQAYRNLAWPIAEGAEEFAAGVGGAYESARRGIQQTATTSARNQSELLARGLESVGLKGAAKSVRRAITVPAVKSLNRQMQREAAAREVESGAGAPYIAGNIAGTASQLIGPGVALRGTTVGRAFLPTSIPGNIAQGAIVGNLQPVADESERGRNTAIGAGIQGGASIVGRGVSGAIRRLATGADISPQRAALAMRAQELGIPLHVSQVGESVPLKTAASVAKYVPFSGAGKAAEAQQQAVNRAVSRTFGNEAPILDETVTQQARQTLGAGYDDIFGRNQVAVRPETLRKMAAIEAEAAKNLTGEEARVVSNQLDRILSDAGETGVMTGRMYQSVRGALAGVKPGTDVGRYVTQMRKALEADAAASLGAEDAAALKALDKQWNNLRVVETLLEQRVAGQSGNIKPADLFHATRTRTSAGKRATKEMRELAKIGQVVLKDPIPDSGTQGRGFVAGLATGNPAALLALPAGVAGARVLNSPTFANVALRGLAPRAGNLTRALEKGSRALPITAQAVTKQKR